MNPTAYIVDVGQGSCNVLITGKYGTGGGNEAIVIDCGPRTPDTPLELLTTKNVAFISALIVTHNDRDHCGGLEKVLGAYRRRIKRVFYTGDRNAEDNSAFGILDNAYKEGWFETTRDFPRGYEPVQIALMDEPYCVYPEAGVTRQNDLDVFIVAPTGTGAYRASKRRDANEASAIVVAASGKGSILFPGDATITSWEHLAQRVGKRLKSDVVIVPHHGGCIHSPRHPKQLTKLYEEIIDCQFAVVSVGTNNRQGRKKPENHHPRHDVLNAIYAAGMRLICTERTENCSKLGQADILKLRSQNLPELPSFSKDDPQKAPCAGTIEIEIRNDGVMFGSLQPIHGDEWCKQQSCVCPLAR